MVAKASLAIPACCLLMLICLLTLSVESPAGAAPEGSGATISLDDSAFAGFGDVHSGGVPYGNKPINPSQPWNTRYVAKSGSDGGNCLDPDEPCLTVQYAVDIAAEGDVVKVAAGVYNDVHARAVPSGYNSPPASGVITQVVYLSKTLSIQGGYTTSNWTEPDLEANLTSLDAQDQGRVLFIHGTISPTIEGLRLTRGNASLLGGSGGRDNGGGVYVIDAAPAFRETEVISNAAGDLGFGGGIYLANSPGVMLIGSTIRQNTAVHAGGLYFDRSPRATLIENDISDNEANRLGPGMKHFGGIRFSYSPDAVLIENTITGNRAADRCGGASFEASDNALLKGNIIEDNSSGTRGFETSSNGGGLLLIGSDGVRLMGNTIANNRTLGNGGGIYEQRSEMVLINNIIADNEVFASDWFTGRGSALYLAGDPQRLLHNTFARNLGGDGSGIYVTDIFGSFCTAELTNTIVASHSVGISVTTGSRVIVDGVLWWDNDENTRGNGQITVTHAYTGNPAFVDPDEGDYHISESSAAIDSGVASAVSDDIDGQYRPCFDGFDLGADEFGRCLLLPVIMKQVPSMW